jgi:hypothetical protein
VQAAGVAQLHTHAALRRDRHDATDRILTGKINGAK